MTRPNYQGRVEKLQLAWIRSIPRSVSKVRQI